MRRSFFEPAIPAGLAFKVADLILLQTWADFHGLRMVVELDHHDADGEYEEVIALYAKDSRLRWLLWRSGEIVIQPLRGARVHCPTVAEAIEILSPRLHGGSD